MSEPPEAWGAPAPLAVITVPAGAERTTATVTTVAVVVPAVLAGVCLLGALALVVLPGPVWVPLLGAAFWGVLAALAWRWRRRATTDPRGRGGTVLGAVRPDGLDVGGLVLPWPAVAEVGLFWFTVRPRGHAQGMGGALADGVVRAADEAAGGAVGLAAVVRPHDPAWLVGGVGVQVRTDPHGRAVAVVKGYRLVTEGDPVAFGRALHDQAARHGVPVGGWAVPPAPPDQLPALEAWLH